MSGGLVSRLLNQKTGISSEMALNLSKVLGRSPESWMLMQGNYALWQAKRVVNLDEYQPFKFA